MANESEAGYEKFIIKANEKSSNKAEERISSSTDSMPYAVYAANDIIKRKKDFANAKEDDINKSMISYNEVVKLIADIENRRLGTDQSIIGSADNKFLAPRLKYESDVDGVSTYETFDCATLFGITNSIKDLMALNDGAKNQYSEIETDLKNTYDFETPIDARIADVSKNIISYVQNVSNGVDALSTILKDVVGLDLTITKVTGKVNARGEEIDAQYISEFNNNTSLTNNSIPSYTGEGNKAAINADNVKGYIDECVNALVDYVSESNNRIFAALNAIASRLDGASDSPKLFGSVTSGSPLLPTVNSNYNTTFTGSKITPAGGTVSSDKGLFGYVKEADAAFFARVATDASGQTAGEILYTV